MIPVDTSLAKPLLALLDHGGGLGRTVNDLVNKAGSALRPSRYEDK